jgi:hypothetical protein
MKCFLIVVVAMALQSGIAMAQEYTFTNNTYSLTGINALESRKAIAGPEPKPKGLRMRNAGRALTLGGIAFAIGGIVLMNNADELYYSSTTSTYGDTEEGDIKGALGVVMLTTGIGMTVPGIILWSKGQKKYKRTLERESVSLRTGRAGVTLAYSF